MSTRSNFKVSVNNARAFNPASKVTQASRWVTNGCTIHSPPLLCTPQLPSVLCTERERVELKTTFLALVYAWNCFAPGNILNNKAKWSQPVSTEIRSKTKCCYGNKTQVLLLLLVKLWNFLFDACDGLAIVRRKNAFEARLRACENTIHPLLLTVFKIKIEHNC